MPDVFDRWPENYERFADAEEIAGVIVQETKTHFDNRGDLTEIWRSDGKVSGLERYKPAMAYTSITHSGVARGPHEHTWQTDLFLFLGSRFHIDLWDNRKDSPTGGNHMFVITGPHIRHFVLIPPGVVHRYANRGPDPGIVINLPDKLYRGFNYESPVDEVRHEDNPYSVFRDRYRLDQYGIQTPYRSSVTEMGGDG